MQEKKTIPLIYALGLPIILIISTFLAHIHFRILGSPLYLSAFIYPLTYLISCLIVKESNYKKAMSVMAMSLLCQCLFFIIHWVILGSMDGILMICTFLSFLLGQIITIYGYDWLRKIGKDGYIAIALLVFIVSIIDNAFFGELIEGQKISLSILVRLFYIVFIPAILAKKDIK